MEGGGEEGWKEVRRRDGRRWGGGRWEEGGREGWRQGGREGQRETEVGSGSECGRNVCVTNTNGERVVSRAHMHTLTGTSLVNLMHLTIRPWQIIPKDSPIILLFYSQIFSLLFSQTSPLFFQTSLLFLHYSQNHIKNFINILMRV